MKFKWVVVLLVGAAIQPAYAVTDSTTIAASTVISPGAYTSTLAPSFDSSMAGRLEKALGSIPGVDAVSAQVDASTVRFTIKSGSNVHLADLQDSVSKADAGAVMTSPVLVNSMTPHLGI